MIIHFIILWLDQVMLKNSEIANLIFSARPLALATPLLVAIERKFAKHGQVATI